MKLYEIKNEYLAALDNAVIDEETGEMIAPFQELQESFNEKAIAVSMYFNGLDAEAEAIKKAEDMMRKRRKAIEDRSQRLRQYLIDNMKECGISEIKCEYFCIKLKQNRVSVDDYEPDLIPDKFKNVKMTYVIDKEAVRKAIEAGEEVHGARLVRKDKLEIK